MTISRRTFVKQGVAAFAVGFAACERASPPQQRAAVPEVPSDRSLVVLYLAGGNDALSFLVPYKDSDYYGRRPTQAVPADRVLPVGADASGKLLGLHPALPGLKGMFDQGHVSIIQRTGYESASRSHFIGCDIMSTGKPDSPQGTGWLGRYLDMLPAPVDPLCNWNTQFQVPHALVADSVRVASIPDPAHYAYSDPWGEAQAATAIASHLPRTDPHLAFLNQTTLTALSTIPRVETVAAYEPSTAYPETELGRSLKTVASGIAQHVGTKVFWVQAAGYDTHATQGTLAGRYAGLLKILDDALSAFHKDLQNQGLLEKTLVLQFSEFGRRIDENGSGGTDHGTAGLMTAVGGSVRGGIYGNAARSLAVRRDNPDLENGGLDLKPETDFRSVYARVMDDWLGADSVQVLQGDYRDPAVDFV